MIPCTNISQYLFHGDVSNKYRNNKWLDPYTVPVMDFGVDEWVSFTSEFAKNINYFENDLILPQGTWEPFYRDLRQLQDLDLYDEGRLPAHQSLYIAFLKLLEYSRSSINHLSKRYQDFYYHEVLQLNNRDFKPDQVFVNFELAKNIEQHRITKDALLDADKSENGILRRYAMDEELIVNKAKIHSVYKQYADDTGVYFSRIEDPQEVKSEWPFGEPLSAYAANYGVSIACADLLYEDGMDSLSLIIEMDQNFSHIFSSSELLDGLKFYISTEKEWELIYPHAIDNKTRSIEVEWKDLKSMIAIPTIELHGRSATAPMIKILFDGTKGREIYLNWIQNRLLKLELSTEKKYDSKFEAKSDTGVISTDKDFYPFGTTPKKDSWFKIHSDEWIGKTIEKLSINIDWKDTPDEFNTHYGGYLQDYFTNNFSLDHTRYNSTQPMVNSSDGSDIFRVYTRDRNSTTPMFVNTSGIFSLQVNFNETIHYGAENIDKSPYRVFLSHDFFHKDYGQINTIAVVLLKTLPQQPYTPISDKMTLSVRTKSASDRIRVFQELPLGFREVRLGSEQVLPSIPSQEGHLFIALDGVRSKDNLQLLFSLEEGTENPDVIEAEGLSTTQWYYLAGNQWTAFNKNQILKNELKDFLNEGLVKLTANSTTSKSTIMPAGLYWIAIKLNGRYDSISRLTGIIAQSGRAIFRDQGNSLEHIENGINSKTIKKLTKRDAQIKKIEQMYPSFGGTPREDDDRFYRRVSERLRHKNRTSSIWDYNHIILENFKYVYKVKTLNHTLRDQFNAPGEVTVLVVPNVIHGKVFNILEPKLSQSRLLEIQDLINQKNTMHVKAGVFNPVYLPVKISTRVKFHEGYDANFYQSQIQRDITDYLAPWSSTNSNELEFGGSIYRSQIINYLENLEYVDYLSDFDMIVNGHLVKEVTPEDPRIIITSVSAEKHQIETIINSPCLT